jgi:hypothetical protein
MTLVHLGEEIASRRLRFTARDGTVTEVLVKIGKPQPKENGIGFYCPFMISGIGWERVEYSAGLDAVQAFQLVMLMIGAKLADDSNNSASHNSAAERHWS